jgi:pimeloyl-ACP methyl ester carboxylesterase
MNTTQASKDETIVNSLNAKATKTREYAPVNGLKMYYEIEGTGDPLVYIPPAFGYAGLKSFPTLIQSHSVITVDLQGHGHTADIPERPISFEQHARDVTGLLKTLGISKADFFGESFGGVIATMIAVHYPDMAGRVATYAATFGAPQIAVRAEVLRPKLAPDPDSRGIQFQRENYKKVAPNPDYWPEIWSKVFNIQWAGFSNEELASIKAPILIALGDHDFVRLEHALETFRLIPNAELAVIPDAGHFALFSEQKRVVPVVESFLKRGEKKIPFATAETGYHPGETR